MLPSWGIECTPVQQAAQFLTQVFPKFYCLHQKFLFFSFSTSHFIHIHYYLWIHESPLPWVTANTFILQYQNNITTTEISFSLFGLLYVPEVTEDTPLSNLTRICWLYVGHDAIFSDSKV